MSLEEVRKLVEERKLNAPIRRRKRRKVVESDKEQSEKPPQTTSSVPQETEPRVDAVDAVGLPAQCGRPHHMAPSL